jgi:hypothetical protein
MKKALIISVSAVAMLAASQPAFAGGDKPDPRGGMEGILGPHHPAILQSTHSTGSYLRALRRARFPVTPPPDTPRKTNHVFPKSSEALGIGGSASPDVRCPPGAVC